MIHSLPDLLGARADSSGAQYPFGCARGFVDKVEDETGERKVRVQLTGTGRDLSVWARLLTFGAGNECGVYFAPPMGTEVLVYFDGPHAYLLGTLWNDQNKPPPGTNKQRVIRTPRGNLISFTDEAGKEAIEISSAGGTSSIVLDAESGTVTVQAAKKIVLAADEVEIVAKKIAMTAQDGGATLESQGPIAVTTPGELTLEGKRRVNIN